MVGDYHMVCPRVGDLVEGELAEVAIGLGRGRRVVERGEAGSAAALVPRHAG
jgi:hypothetical protein